MNKEEQKAIAELKEQIKQDTAELPYSEESLRYKQTILNLINKLQKKNEQSQKILSRIKIIYQVHTKDCELTLKDIKKWEKILDK